MVRVRHRGPGYSHKTVLWHFRYTHKQFHFSHNNTLLPGNKATTFHKKRLYRHAALVGIMGEIDMYTWC